MSLENVSISSAESLSCAFEMFVPPPPPPNLMNDTDDSNGSDLDDDNADFSDIEIPDFCDDSINQDDKSDKSNHFGTIIRKKPGNNDNFIHNVKPKNLPLPPKEENSHNFRTEIQKDERKSQTANNSSQYVASDPPVSNIEKPMNLPLPNAAKADKKQNLLVGELKGKLMKSNHINDEEPTRNNFSKLDSPVNNFSKNIDNSPNIPRRDFNQASKLQHDLKPKALFNQIGNELLDKNRKSLKDTNNSIKNNDEKKDSSFQNKFLVPKKNDLQVEIKTTKFPIVKTSFEIDSGHGTARSDYGKNDEENNINSKVLHKTISKTWSSCSSGVEGSIQITEDNRDDNDMTDDDDFMESEYVDEKPKVNLRDLMKKMKTYDSDTDDETFDFKSGSQNDTVIRYFILLILC